MSAIEQSPRWCPVCQEYENHHLQKRDDEASTIWEGVALKYTLEIWKCGGCGTLALVSHDSRLSNSSGGWVRPE